MIIKLKTTILFLLAFVAIATLSYPSGDTNSKDLIIISSLPTPPPGYVIDKSFGNFVFLDTVPLALPSVINRSIAETGQRIAKAIRATGANAILNEKIEITVTSNSGLANPSTVYVFFTGESVSLKPAP